MSRQEDHPRPRSFRVSSELQSRMHNLIPGGAHTYARGSDQYPEGMAPIIEKGAGARVWDVDGNEFVEFGIGLRSVTLGHGYRPVVEAACSAIADGMNFTRPTRLELSAAEDFLGLVPGAEMVKFAKNGSDATTAAIRLSRAATGRSKVAICNQPFFSVDDWFIGTTPMRKGIPSDIAAIGPRFSFNDMDSVHTAIGSGDVACLIMEPATALAEPNPGFLEGVRDLCSYFGTLLIFDEMITGFRWSAGGAQTLYGVQPDLSCWGKAMGNGFPIAALAGKRELMELGGLRTDRERVFLLSTTHGPETASLAAFRAVVRAYAAENPIAQMERAGSRLASEVNRLAADSGIDSFLKVSGRPSCLIFETRDGEGKPSQAFRTLFLQELLTRGILGQSFVTSAAHGDREIEETILACEGALAVYRQAIENNSVNGVLRGRPVAPAIRQFASPRQL